MGDEQSDKKEGLKIGYARVSTTDQKLQSQMDVLEKHGCGIKRVNTGG